ncbi:type II toxin-antitoxin system VapC family toxin [Methylobacterium currus]|uniref:Type II toxin-antitoxin system VapC family toxin n=1 Tax=Methylobacterium currus TaxID=2051553 RepID=A0A2R4WMY6_9HYPH|nr:type II toxin-antitoxin system VapC family toxin [Methylobacterium currus]
MIVVDASALMAIAQDEAQAAACTAVLVAEPHILISAGTSAEAMIVSGRRNVAEGVRALVDDLAFEIFPVTAAVAYDCAAAYATWGKGVHPAGLNLGDCFADMLATARGCPLLFVGDDFAHTDVTNALSTAQKRPRSCKAPPDGLIAAHRNPELRAWMSACSSRSATTAG